MLERFQVTRKVRGFGALQAMILSAAVAMTTSSCFQFGKCEPRDCPFFDLLDWCDSQASCTNTLNVSHRVGMEHGGPVSWDVLGAGQLEIPGVQALAGLAGLRDVFVSGSTGQRVRVLVDGAELSCSPMQTAWADEKCVLPPNFETFTVITTSEVRALRVFLREPEPCPEAHVCGL